MLVWKKITGAEGEGERGKTERNLEKKTKTQSRISKRPHHVGFSRRFLENAVSRRGVVGVAVKTCKSPTKP
jgi:hypothetical protein